MKLDDTRPGKPTDNGLIESFKVRLRDEFLNVNAFIAMQDAREKLKAWQHGYSHHCPHGALGYLTPSEFVRKRRSSAAMAAHRAGLRVTRPGLSALRRLVNLSTHSA